LREQQRYNQTAEQLADAFGMNPEQTQRIDQPDETRKQNNRTNAREPDRYKK